MALECTLENVSLLVQSGTLENVFFPIIHFAVMLHAAAILIIEFLFHYVN